MDWKRGEARGLRFRGVFHFPKQLGLGSGASHHILVYFHDPQFPFLVLFENDVAPRARLLVIDGSNNAVPPVFVD